MSVLWLKGRKERQAGILVKQAAEALERESCFEKFSAPEYYNGWLKLFHERVHELKAEFQKLGVQWNPSLYKKELARILITFCQNVSSLAAQWRAAYSYREAFEHIARLHQEYNQEQSTPGRVQNNEVQDYYRSIERAKMTLRTLSSTFMSWSRTLKAPRPS